MDVRFLVSLTTLIDETGRRKMDTFTRHHLEAYAKQAFSDGHTVGFVSWVSSHDAEDLDDWGRVGWPSAADEYRKSDYYAYVEACDDENVDAHGWHMWDVHDRPKGPIG